jgi:hypothetical protein
MSQVKNASNNNSDVNVLMKAIFRSIPAARRVAEVSGLTGRPEGVLLKAS